MSKARILAVDDQRYFRELIEGLLEDEGYAVHACASGEEALHLFEREDFDVVVTDLVMPGIDGAELVRRIKERRPEQDVVMVTGVVDVKTAVDAMKLGATDYILKPYDRATIVDALEKILAQKRLREEHARLMEENLEFMGVLSLVERANALFSTLSVEPLAERLIEGLCLETRAQSGVLWVAEEPGRASLELVGARGLVRVDGEPDRIELAEVEAAWCPGLSAARSVVAAMPEDVDGVEALYVPIRAAGETLGVARLSDKLDGDAFDARDRSMAEKFAEFGGVAVQNALRFRGLERRSLRDPETRAYTLAYFEDAVRNEIQKATRFGHRFGVLRVDVDGMQSEDGGAEAPLERDRVETARRIEGSLRATDLMATDDEGAFLILLPQTDALGAGVLGQRIRGAIAALFEGRPMPTMRLGAATFPVDGTQLEPLEAVLETRVTQAGDSLLVRFPELARLGALDPRFDRMVELGSVVPADTEGQVLRFVLEDVVRRPAERGVLYLSPGPRWLPEILEVLEEIRELPCRTEIVLIAEGEAREVSPRVTWVNKSALDPRRPFVAYFGDGPAYAMVGQPSGQAERVPVFQTADRALVEHLAFELQRELGISLAI